MKTYMFTQTPYSLDAILMNVFSEPPSCLSNTVGPRKMKKHLLYYDMHMTIPVILQTQFGQHYVLRYEVK